MFCYAILCVHSIFATISMGKRELVALHCLPGVSGLFVTLPYNAMGSPAVCDCGIF